MGLRYLDSTGNFSEPIKTSLLYLDANKQWTRPGGGSSLLYYGADGRWSKPVVGTPAGDLPVGTPGNDTLVKFLTLFGEPIVWRVIGKDLPGMPAGSVTLFCDKIVAIRCFDASEPSNREPNRSTSGNDDWSVSNLRQWMNSDASAGQWYSKQHIYDAPPDYQSKPGMLYESMPQERDLLMATTRSFVTSVYNGYKYEETGKQTVDKVFALTTTELIIEGRENNGTRIPYFTDGIGRIAQCTAQCLEDVGYRPDASVDFYWTSTSNPTQGSLVHVVKRNNGLLDNYQANYAVSDGVRPACNIPQSVTFSATPDEDGCYTLTL